MTAAIETFSPANQKRPEHFSSTVSVVDHYQQWVEQNCMNVHHNSSHTNCYIYYDETLTCTITYIAATNSLSKHPLTHEVSINALHSWAHIV